MDVGIAQGVINAIIDVWADGGTASATRPRLRLAIRDQRLDVHAGSGEPDQPASDMGFEIAHLRVSTHEQLVTLTSCARVLPEKEDWRAAAALGIGAAIFSVVLQQSPADHILGKHLVACANGPEYTISLGAGALADILRDAPTVRQGLEQFEVCGATCKPGILVVSARAIGAAPANNR